MSMHGVDEGWQWVDRKEIPVEAEEFIRSDWAERMAYGIAGQNPGWWDYVDDLAQEARLQMWRDAETWDGRGRVVPFVMQRGRWRITAIISGRQRFTGHVRVEQRGLPVAAERPRTRSLDQLHEEIGFEIVDSIDYIDGVLSRYHEGEVAQAISELPPRWQEYIRLKFWEGLGDREIAAQMGDQRKRWRTHVAPQLAQRLAHLVDA